MLQRSFVFKIIGCLMLAGCFMLKSRAQDTIMYYGGYYDGTAMSLYSSFSPQTANQQYAYTGGNHDGYGAARINAFSPAILNHYAMYTADTTRADGYAIAGVHNYNRSFLSQYTPYTSGMLGDGYAGHMVLNIPLPLDLMAFTGSVAGTGALLQWSMADEKHVVRYELERSPDGRTFALINTQSVTHSTAAPVTRQYTDEHPFPGKDFYRLKISGENGKYSYSNIVLLFFDEAGASLAVFPNPAREQITMQYQASREGTARIVDMKGTLLQTIAMPAGSHTLSLPLKSLPAGVYLLNIINPESAMKTIRFVKE